MRTQPCPTRRPDVLAIILLAALVFRAYIPIGFMPASGTPLRVQLCPAYEGTLSAQHVHNHHSQGHADFQNCPFGSAPAQGPISHLLVFESSGQIPFSLNIPAEPQRGSTQLLRIQQPRGPPTLA
jgi:hypothetical protein